jgi:hypothetical protein
MFAERQAQIWYCWQNLVCYCKKGLNVKDLFFLIKVWNIKNVSIWFQQKPIPQLSMFCFIQGINNYVQINTYWSYIVWICIFIDLASNKLLLASKKCFLTSQGLVGAGMNCRALFWRDFFVVEWIVLRALGSTLYVDSFPQSFTVSEMDLTERGRKVPIS